MNTPSKLKSGAHCHLMVAKAAQEMTRALYDETMKNDALWVRWQALHPGLSRKGLEDAFVKKYWPAAIEGARATLARMLVYPLDEVLKDEITSALILDASLVKGRRDQIKAL